MSDNENYIHTDEININPLSELFFIINGEEVIEKYVTTNSD